MSALLSCSHWEWAQKKCTIWISRWTEEKVNRWIRKYSKSWWWNLGGGNMRVFSIKSFPPDIMFEIFNKCYEKNLPLILRTSRILRCAYWAQDWEHPCSVAWLSDLALMANQILQIYQMGLIVQEMRFTRNNPLDAQMFHVHLNFRNFFRGLRLLAKNCVFLNKFIYF